VLATLEVAFWSLLNTDTFEDAVVEVVNRGDDSDTVGAVTGALAGAYYGVGAIPSRWMQTLMRCSDLVRYADDLHRLAVPDVPEFEYACIVPDRVYIGRNPLSRDDVERLVRESGITHVLDLREPWEFSAPRQGEEALASLNEHGVRRLHIPVQDMQAPTHADIGAAVSYIEETLANPAARLYLHCRAGKERSGCVAVAWYAQKHGIEYDETLSRLQKARPSIWPLPGQELAIRAWLNRRFQHNSAVSGIMDNATTVTVLPLTCNTSDSEDKIMSTLQGPDQDVPETIEFQHSAVILYVGRLLHGKDASDISAVYRAARYAWRVDCKRAAQHELVLAVVRGVVKGVFANIHWMQATEENFPGFEPKLPKKWGFTADNAADDIARLYIGKRLPASMTKRGAAFPVKYAERELGQICRGL
jgi:protein-tyrosine phosphatase